MVGLLDIVRDVFTQRQQQKILRLKTEFAELEKKIGEERKKRSELYDKMHQAGGDIWHDAIKEKHRVLRQLEDHKDEIEYRLLLEGAL